ncbi:hypothetical protein GOODEAATRI_001030 [Goodea atripinnis]|uniref:Uncharacterized protein n=1 Tax=Goodea atripinnis TaxID=208336 RepID=A0ABV0PUD2_9TELE
MCGSNQHPNGQKNDGWRSRSREGVKECRSRNHSQQRASVDDEEEEEEEEYTSCSPEAPSALERGKGRRRGRSQPSGAAGTGAASDVPLASK